jgi:predicted metal-dependent phosphoesterase TrpH
MTVRIDLHVHTARYSQCAEFLDPYQIGAVAVAAGLDGVVLADHDVLWEDEELELLRAASTPIRIYRGIEVSTAYGHVVVIGLEDAGRIHKGIGIRDLVLLARASGAATILAHPYRDTVPLRETASAVDAIEVASTSFSSDEPARSRRLARSAGKPMVASSDAHALSRIGWASTEFASLPADDLDLARMIVSGCCSPYVPSRPRPTPITNR